MSACVAKRRKDSWTWGHCGLHLLVVLRSPPNYLLYQLCRNLCGHVVVAVVWSNVTLHHNLSRLLLLYKRGPLRPVFSGQGTTQLQKFLISSSRFRSHKLYNVSTEHKLSWSTTSYIKPRGNKHPLWWFHGGLGAVTTWQGSFGILLRWFWWTFLPFHSAVRKMCLSHRRSVLRDLWLCHVSLFSNPSM